LQSDIEIVEAVLGGDRAAFAGLVKRYERSVWATTVGILRDHHAAQDVVQEAFLTAYLQLGALRDRAKFGAWIIKIARRKAVEIARRHRRTVHCSVSPDMVVDCRDTQISEAVEELLAAVTRLPLLERQFLLQHYFDGLSTQEIAQATGRPTGTITKYLSRAYRRLRRQLKRIFQARFDVSCFVPTGSAVSVPEM